MLWETRPYIKISHMIIFTIYLQCFLGKRSAEVSDWIRSRDSARLEMMHYETFICRAQVSGT